MKKRPDISGSEKEIKRKYDAIAHRIDVQYPRPAGLPREDHNPVRLLRRLLLEEGLPWPPICSVGLNRTYTPGVQVRYRLDYFASLAMTKLITVLGLREELVGRHLGHF